MTYSYDFKFIIFISLTTLIVYMNQRTVLIGIDGVPFELMDDLSNRGIMPNFNKLKKEGTFLRMRSSIPHISSVSWSSIITGKNPGEHGIFGFMDIIPGTYTLSFSNFETLKEKPFWMKNKKKNIIINVPMTYPSKETEDTIHIAGFVALDLEGSVTPKSELQKLKEFDYRVDVDSTLAHESKFAFLRDLFETLEARKKTYKYYWNKDWDVFMFVITGSDRLEHFLWDSYENEDDNYNKDFLKFFKEVDEIIGEIDSKLNQDDKLMIISDHGMERIKTNVNLNVFLQEKGFLDLKDEGVRFNRITEKTKAFVLDPGRIYIHSEGKYPKGSVKPEEKKKIIKELIDVFQNLEWNREKVIKKVYKRDEIYKGKCIENAPDLVVVENPGFRLKGKIDATKLFDDEIFTGKHTAENSVLFVKNISIDIPNPTVEDVLKIIGEE